MLVNPGRCTSQDLKGSARTNLMCSCIQCDSKGKKPCECRGGLRKEVEEDKLGGRLTFNRLLLSARRFTIVHS